MDVSVSDAISKGHPILCHLGSVFPGYDGVIFDRVYPSDDLHITLTESKYSQARKNLPLVDVEIAVARAIFDWAPLVDDPEVLLPCYEKLVMARGLRQEEAKELRRKLVEGESVAKLYLLKKRGKPNSKLCSEDRECITVKSMTALGLKEGSKLKANNIKFVQTAGSR